VKTCNITANCSIRFIAKYYYDVQIKLDEMSEAYSMHGSYEKCTQNFGQKIGKNKLEDLGM
jgi:hypothetical protein